MSPLPGNRYYCVIKYVMRVPVVVRRVVNCYTQYTLPYLSLPIFVSGCERRNVRANVVRNSGVGLGFG